MKAKVVRVVVVLEAAALAVAVALVAVAVGFPAAVEHLQVTELPVRVNQVQVALVGVGLAVCSVALANRVLVQALVSQVLARIRTHRVRRSAGKIHRPRQIHTIVAVAMGILNRAARESAGRTHRHRVRLRMRINQVAAVVI